MMTQYWKPEMLEIKFLSITRMESDGSEPDKAACLAAARLSTSSTHQKKKRSLGVRFNQGNKSIKYSTSGKKVPDCTTYSKQYNDSNNQALFY